MALIVQKYGGKTLSTPEMVRRVAQQIANLRATGSQVIVIVSAMGETTNSLQSLAFEVSQKPNRREFDMLLSTGERVSASLLSIALNDLGCEAISFTGSQAGIMTDQSHTDATIKEVRPIRVTAEIEKGKVVVLAGFQGVCPTSKEITTLGRGGSDATAVAMADHFKAYRCEILKDVDGIYSADPKKFTNAKKIKQISLIQLSEMAYWGGHFLHYRSAQMALQKGTPIFIGSAHDASSGTLALSPIEEKPSLSAVSVHALSSIFASPVGDPKPESKTHDLGNDIEIETENTLSELGLRFLFKDKNTGLNYYQRIAYDSSPTETENTSNEKTRLLNPAQSIYKDDLASVTIVLSTAPSANTIDKLKKLVKEIAPIHACSQGQTSLTFLIDEKNLFQVQTALHAQCTRFTLQ